jgi:Rrf2 family iron-sulfur cluster assembly transcriptional regulator
MRLSTKGRFAVTAMIDLALREQSGPVPLSEIALRHQISLSYLEQMFSRLRQRGLVASTRGPGGGYTLSQPAQLITVADIVATVEGHDAESVEPMAKGKARDMTQELWDTLNSKMLDYMQSITLHSLVLEQRDKGAPVETQKVANRGVFKKPLAETARSSTPNSVFALGKTLLARG